MNVGNSKFKTASLLLIRPRLQVSKWLASHEQRHATSLLCGELCHWAAFNCRAKTDVCFSGIPMNSLCQSFRRLPLFFFFFYIFLSFSFHFPFAGQHEPQASQNSGRGGPGKLPPQLQAGKTPKTNVKTPRYARPNKEFVTSCLSKSR